MSGPKIIDTAALRSVERAKLAALCARIGAAMSGCNAAIADLSASAKYEFREFSAEVVDELLEAGGSDQLLEIQSATRHAAALLDEVKSVRRDVRAAAIEQRANDGANRRALDKMADALRARAEGDAEAIALLDQAGAAAGVAERAKFLEQAGAALSEAEARQEKVQGEELAAAWLAELGGGGVQTIEAPMTRGQREAARWLAELEVFAPEDVATYRAKLESLEGLPGDRRALAMDSLRIELAERARFGRAVEARRDLVEEWRAVLVEGEAGSDGVELLAEMERFVGAEGDDFVVALRALESWEEARLQRLSAERSREAILEALGSLGYEVHEGMGRAWSEAGKIYLTKPQPDGYAVELAALPAGESMLRTRLVRYGRPVAETPDERQRDVEAEEEWCGEHAEMVERLRQDEISVDIKAARGVGASPLEAIAATGERERRAENKGREREAR